MFYRTRNKLDVQSVQQFGGWRSVRSWLRLARLLLLAAWTQASGQVSLLDPSFNIGPGASDTVDALVVQADQRILVGGEFTTIGGCSNSFLVRLNSDGSVDQSFNPSGQTDGAVQCLLQQPDRKVLVGGAFGRLLGQTQTALARLLEDGSVDVSFDASAALSTNTTVYSVAQQNDSRLLVGYYSWIDGVSRIVRVNTNGTPDPTFVCTNQFDGYVLTFLPQSDGTVLCGGNFTGLFRLKPDGRLDDAFEAGLDRSSVFGLVRQPNGQILVGGLLNRTGASNGVPLLRLNTDLQWDDGFKPDAFGAAGPGGPSISALLRQPDGKIIAGGKFFDVGGYWRRHIVRFTAEGHVDGCFDPGLGLGTYWDGPVPVRAIAMQPDGRILIGGLFPGIETAAWQKNLARLLPQSDCDLIRVYLEDGDYAFTAATFPPGRTNYLERSIDLKTWQAVGTNTSPYIIYYNFSTPDAPQAFFRARQER
jgi:uncharacterized delta-60 repeat protein